MIDTHIIYILLELFYFKITKVIFILFCKKYCLFCIVIAYKLKLEINYKIIL